MDGFNIKCKKCKKFMIYDAYLWRDNNEDYYCTKCWWYKVVLPFLKNLSVKNDIEKIKAHYFFIYDHDTRLN